MVRLKRNLKFAVTALVVSVAPLSAQEGTPDRLADLFAALQVAEGDDALQIASKIVEEWSRSGSATMDFLLRRGRDALEAGDTTQAIGHLTALVDHAPDFAEGYNARATAFFQARKYGPALDDIRTTLALNPRHFGAMTGLAIMLEEIDEPVAALMAWREVRRYYPASPEAQNAIPRLEREVEGSTL